MFLDFYRLHQQPFGVTPDPAFLYPSRTHCEALDSLAEGILEGRGFLALIAEPGMGKTTLLYQVLEGLRDTARAAFLFQTQCNSREFFQYLLSELGVDSTGMGLVAMHNKLNEMLFAEMLAGKRFVLIVDEAQNLDDSVLETIRLLSNFETSHTKLLQIVLAGQSQLAEKLATEAAGATVAAHCGGEASGCSIAGGNGRLHPAPAESGRPLRRRAIRAGGLGTDRRAKRRNSEEHQQDLLRRFMGSTCPRVPHGVAGHCREGASQFGCHGCCSSDSEADAGAIAFACGHRFCGGSRHSCDKRAFLHATGGVWRG